MRNNCSASLKVHIDDLQSWLKNPAGILSPEAKKKFAAIIQLNW
jgi:aconitase B